MSKDELLEKLAILGACVALLPIIYALVTSRSQTPWILGPWSLQISVLILISAGLLLAGIITIFKKSLLRRLMHLLGGLPGFMAATMLIFLPLGILIIWYLFPNPLLDRQWFTPALIALSLFPGVMILLGKDEAHRRKAFQGYLTMLVSLLLTIAASEMVLRIVMPKSIFDPRFGLRPYQRTELQVDLEGVTPGGTLSTNRWGFRGEDPPEDWDSWLTIVTIGGSTTANYYLDDSLTWSSVLQERLREVEPEVWVGNAGIPRHSSETHALFVRDVLSRIKPDVALFLVGVNDMGPFLRGRRTMEERLPDTGPRTWLFRNSMILQLFYKIKKTAIDGAPVITGTVDPYFVEEPLPAEEDPLPGDLHDLLAEPDFYRARIRRLITECREIDVIPIFMTQPLLYDDTEHWRGILGGGIWVGESDRPISAATYWLMLQTLNSDLKEVCAEEGVPVLDLAGIVPHSMEYFYDSMHMTEDGAAFVGNSAFLFLLEYLDEIGMLPAQRQ